jgi:hypothetical protein
MNIKIIAESRQEEILYTPHHINYNLIGYTKLTIVRSYHIKNCPKKDMNHVLSLSNIQLAYFFYGNESAWKTLFRNREPDYVEFDHSTMLLLDKNQAGSYFDFNVNVSCTFILYVKENPNLNFLPLFYLILATLIFMLLVYLSY